MVKISQGHILDWIVLHPSLNEQRNIANYIEAKISKIENLRDYFERTIELLHERRAALIAAAVSEQVRVGA
jgi:type I restriction enzyme S subunit